MVQYCLSRQDSVCSSRLDWHLDKWGSTVSVQSRRETVKDVHMRVCACASVCVSLCCVWVASVRGMQQEPARQASSQWTTVAVHPSGFMAWFLAHLGQTRPHYWSHEHIQYTQCQVYAKLHHDVLIIFIFKCPNQNMHSIPWKLTVIQEGRCTSGDFLGFKSHI